MAPTTDSGRFGERLAVPLPTHPGLAVLDCRERFNRGGMDKPDFVGEAGISRTNQPEVQLQKQLR